MNRRVINVLCVAALGLSLWVGLRGTPSPSPPDPQPPRPADIGAIAAHFPGEIARRQAAVYLECERQIKAGMLSGEKAVAEFLTPRNKQEIDTAYTPLDAAIQARLGEGRWTDELAAQVFGQIGRALQKKGGGL
jgi:hypothetical protein